MKAIELFAGVGGFRLGLERNNINVIWANEWDKYATQTYDKNFEGEINAGDITTISTKRIPDHDLLVGGFPCQAFSIAGKRKGFNETRGTLFFDVARILKDKRPRHLILENVKGLLTHEGGKTFQTILEVLAQLGYRVEWQVLNSADFGVPQNRERVYIIGHLRGECNRQIFPIDGNDELFNAPTGAKESRTPTQLSTTVRIGQSTKADATYVKQIGSLSESHHNPQSQRVYDKEGISPTLDVMGGGNRQPKIMQGAAIRSRNYRGEPAKLEIRTDKVSNTIDQVQKDYMATDGVKIRRLTPIECERLQGFPDNWTAGVSDTQRYKQMGNAVTVNVVSAIAKKLVLHNT